MTYRRILLERDGPLAIVRLNAPETLNAVDDLMREELPEAMGGLIDDDAVRAILITGEGRAFCAGANLKNMHAVQSDGGSPDVGRSLRNGFNPMLLRIAEAGKPVISAVNGAAVGVGCGLALAADIVLVGRSGYFFQSFIRLGVVPDGGSSWVLPRLAGQSRAAAMMMLGDKIDAETAVARGLAYKMHEDHDLMDAARTLGRQLASGPTGAYARIKEMLGKSLRNGLADQLELEARHQQGAFATADCREGVSAFVEKREPDFKGR